VSGSLRRRIDNNNRLSVSGDLSGVGIVCLGERQGCLDPGSEFVGVDERGHFHQLALIGLDDEEGLLDAFVE